MADSFEQHGETLKWSPSLDQMLQGHEECTHVLGLFYQFDPRMRTLQELLKNEELCNKFIVFHGNEKTYGTPSKKQPKYVECITFSAGLFHPHVLILVHKQFLRVWIGSTNIKSKHFGCDKQEAAYVENFPILETPCDSHASDFGCELELMLNAVSDMAKAGTPQDKLREVIALLKNYKIKTDARLIIGMRDSNTLLNLQHPRQRLNKLCKKTTGGDTLVICNSYLSEAKKNPTFHEFFDQFKRNCGVEKMFFGADSEEQAIDMCKFKKVARGLTLENHGPLSVRPLICKVVYKEAINKQMFVHGKSGVCFDKECREVWAIVGGINFACAGWGNYLESQPKNFEVSVFLHGNNSRLQELLR